MSIVLHPHHLCSVLASSSCHKLEQIKQYTEKETENDKRATMIGLQQKHVPGCGYAAGQLVGSRRQWTDQWSWCCSLTTTTVVVVVVVSANTTHTTFANCQGTHYDQDLLYNSLIFIYFLAEWKYVVEYCN